MFRTALQPPGMFHVEHLCRLPRMFGAICEEFREAKFFAKKAAPEVLKNCTISATWREGGTSRRWRGAESLNARCGRARWNAAAGRHGLNSLYSIMRRDGEISCNAPTGPTGRRGLAGADPTSYSQVSNARPGAPIHRGMLRPGPPAELSGLRVPARGYM